MLDSGCLILEKSFTAENAEGAEIFLDRIDTVFFRHGLTRIHTDSSIVSNRGLARIYTDLTDKNPNNSVFLNKNAKKAPFFATEDTRLGAGASRSRTEVTEKNTTFSPAIYGRVFVLI